MRAGRVVLSVLGAAALSGVAIWLAAGHQARLRLGEENRALRRQLDQMDGLIADNERLSNLVAQASGSQSLTDDQLRELLRLRGEAGVLREQRQELETLREENRRVRAALESRLKAQSAGAAGTAATADYWPRDSWAFAGYASPEAALQTFFWAVSTGELETALSGTTGEIQEMGEKEKEGKSEGEASAKAIADFATYKSVDVLDREVQADDAVVLNIAVVDKKRTITAKVLMKKIDNDWKFSGAAD